MKRFFKIFFIVGCFFWAFVFGFIVFIFVPITPREPQVAIEKGMTSREISSLLESQGIVFNRWLFLLYVRIQRQGKELKAGEYLFEGKVSPVEVLDRLFKGQVEVLKARIIEGWSLTEVANYLSSPPFIKDPNFRTGFLRLSQDSIFIQSLNLTVPTLEGYLFPETYYLSSDMTVSEVFKIFVTEFEKKYQEALQGLKTLPSLSQHQVVTLASLIEKETGVEEERTIIASVFHNRLVKGMPLQSDPTVIYGLKGFTGDIKKEDLSNPHPYNTYLRAGLPPGPICNPGLASLKAALQPAESEFLYFVSKKDGTHYFSRTADEHAKAVRKYQL